jgi:hypothetical protein
VRPTPAGSPARIDAMDLDLKRDTRAVIDQIVNLRDSL